jgi:hypothetical protein
MWVVSKYGILLMAFQANFSLDINGTNPMNIINYSVFQGNETELVRFNFSTSLRSVKDPLVVAGYLTRGSLIFDFAQVSIVQTNFGLIPF